MSELLKEAIEWLTFEGVGHYGVHHGCYFSALTVVKDIDYEVKCLVYKDYGQDVIEFDDCGHGQFHCGEVNKKLATLLAEGGDLEDGYSLVLEVLKEAYKKWQEEQNAD